MNQFQYALNIKEIDRLKTFKAKDEFARRIAEPLKGILSWRGLDIEDDIPSAIRSYKCLAKVLSLITGKSDCPGFIYSIKNQLEANFISKFNTQDSGLTYEDFLNTFEFTTSIYLGNYTPQNFKPTILLIGDNTPPFKIKYNMYPTSKFRELLTPPYSVASSILLELEEFKRTLPNNIQYTMLEHCLTSNYTEMTKEFTIDDIDLTISNLQQSAMTMRQRLLDEQS